LLWADGDGRYPEEPAANGLFSTVGAGAGCAICMGDESDELDFAFAVRAAPPTPDELAALVRRFGVATDAGLFSLTTRTGELGLEDSSFSSIMLPPLPQPGSYRILIVASRDTDTCTCDLLAWPAAPAPDELLRLHTVNGRRVVLALGHAVPPIYRV